MKKKYCRGAGIKQLQINTASVPVFFFCFFFLNKTEVKAQFFLQTTGDFFHGNSASIKFLVAPTTGTIPLKTTVEKPMTAQLQVLSAGRPHFPLC